MFSFTRFDAGFLCGASLLIAYQELRPALPFWPFVVASLIMSFGGSYLAQRLLSK